MELNELRNELSDFYGNQLHDLHTACDEKCRAALDASIEDGLPAIVQKGMQYTILAEELTPILHRHTAFYAEVCANEAIEMPRTPGQWVYRKNYDRYRQYGQKVYDEMRVCRSYPLYSFCGEFGDEQYHFVFESEPILREGFRGVYEKTVSQLASPDLSEDERHFLTAVEKGMLAVKKVAERFSALAAEKAACAATGDERAHYRFIADTSSRIPWEAPTSFFEALEVLAFIQNVIPALEGGNLCGSGRLDVLLIDFYRRDIASGKLTEDEAYKLIAEFLLLYDLRIPHGMPDQSDSLVNARYTLGGCDENGEPVFNELTKLFLKVDREQEIIYPMVKCRFSASSPADYLNYINETLRNGKSTLLYANDDALIPAFRRAGIGEKDARNYSLLGCWEPVVPGCSNEHCAYLSLIKIFELSVHGGLMRDELPFIIRPLSGASSFDEVLNITLGNIHAVMESRARVAVTARPYWSKIDPHPLLSSTLRDCIEKRRDLTDGGAHYYLDEIICAGLPNVLDSLLTIKELCFDKKKYTLDELLSCVQNNWDNDTMRRDALSCHFHGDESEESMALAKVITDDIAAYAEGLPALYGGRVTIGYMLFMEMYRWAKDLRATPDGRHNGDYFARGLTPSDLHKISAVTGVINSCRAFDPTGIAGDSVLSITMPYGKMPLSVWEIVVRQAASTGVGAIHLNCASREDLLDARVHPEKHKSLVVRVCGYSARFTSLPACAQDDFLKRNILE